jgi:hypothetical protein
MQVPGTVTPWANVPDGGMQLHVGTEQPVESHPTPPVHPPIWTHWVMQVALAQGPPVVVGEPVVVATQVIPGAC